MPSFTQSATTLLATLGGQPQVVTFALDLLLQQSEAVDEVVVVHPPPHTTALQQSLRVLAGEFAGNQYQGHGCHLRRVEIDGQPDSVGEIEDELAAEAVWQLFHGLIRKLKADDRRLHVLVTGGPRLTGLLALSAATLLFDHTDRLWHLYTPRALREQARGGALLHAGPEAGVRLIPVPMAPWGAYFPALRDLAQVTPQQAIAERTRQMEHREHVRCRAVLAQLKPRQVEALQALAAGLSPQEVAERMVVSLKTVDGYKTAILAECRVAWELGEDEYLTYHWLRDKFRRYFALTTSV